MSQAQHSLRVHVPNNWVLRVLVIVIMVQVFGKYMGFLGTWTLGDCFFGLGFRWRSLLCFAAQAVLNVSSLELCVTNAAFVAL